MKHTGAMVDRRISLAVLAALLVTGPDDHGAARAASHRIVAVELSVPGLWADQVEAQVTAPIENALSLIADVVAIRSVSGDPGRCEIEVDFGTEPDPAQQAAVAAAVQRAVSALVPAVSRPLIEVRAGRLF